MNEIMSEEELREEREYKERHNIPVNLTYPNSDIYDYMTRIDVIDLDLECKLDIESGNGFIISKPRGTVKKEMKNENGIYSSKFGQKLGDQNPFADRYSCECGFLKSHINHGIECPICHTKCKFVDDDFKKFGWIVLKDKYHLIHPKFYDSLEYIMGASKFDVNRKKIKGSKLQNILKYNPEVDEHGNNERPCEFKPDGEPFYGIGMMEFYNRFDEILDYYIKKYPKKIEYYEEIQHYRDLVFMHSIPVYTTHLRPSDIKDGYMYFEPTNALYNNINNNVERINRDQKKMDNDPKTKNLKLYDTQMKFKELCNEIMEILSGKKGVLRMLVGARYNFSCRAVIVQDPTLRIDQIKLPYTELVICLQQRIINILIRSYNISPSEAYDKWRNAIATFDERVAEIIDLLIKSTPEGLPVILNRNPTINFGSILQMYCIGYTKNLTMSIPLQVLPLLGADFDGDVLNVFHILNNEFLRRCEIIFNPRNNMYISKIDGKMNDAVMVQRDTIINSNTIIRFGRKNYSKETLDKIEEIKKKQAKYFESEKDLK